MKALVIEDDASVAEFLHVTIAAEGYDVTVAPTGNAAIAHIHGHTPQLILLDMHLPDMWGDEILRRIRAQQHLQQTYVVVFSGETDSLLQQVRQDANLVLTKPISYDTLATLIGRLANRHRFH